MLKSLLATTAIALSLSLSPLSVLAELETTAQTDIPAATISAEKLTLINELRVLTNRDQNATKMLDIMMQQMQEQVSVMGQSLLGDNVDPETMAAFNETFNRVTDRMYDLMQAEIDFVAVQTEIDLMLYDEYFTEAELQDLVAFYETPTGQKTAEIYPQLTQRSMELFGAAVTPTIIKIQQQVLMEEFATGFGMMEDGMPPAAGESEEMPVEAAPEETAI